LQIALPITISRKTSGLRQVSGENSSMLSFREEASATRLVYNRCFQSLTFVLGEGHRLALDENIYEIRREKLKKIEALGHPAYPRKYNYSHTVAQILAEYGGQTSRN
jgi:hypothetical protein